MIANKLRHRLDRAEWHITVVDRDDEHHYQPGYLFVTFGGCSHEQVVRSRPLPGRRARVIRSTGADVHPARGLPDG